tara:strand:+ start:1530 stop:2204 length:675 start_codon:yes stop_codon:yes gene_type:complete
MGYLDNSSITVDAILTKKGRELLAKGRDNFVITQFALADDEVDYNLFNTAHPLGSDFYGIIIENLPLVEATTDENFMMKYKLLSLPKNTVRIPKVSALPVSVSIKEGGQTATVNILTLHSTGNTQLGYTVTLLNSDAATITGDGNGIGVNTDPIGANEDRRSVTITTGGSFTITSKILSDNTDISTKIIIVGNETGGRDEVSLTVTNDTTISVGSTIDQTKTGI